MRIQGYLNRWIELSKLEHTFVGLQNLIVKEQALNACDENLKMFIMERCPKDVKE